MAARLVGSRGSAIGTGIEHSGSRLYIVQCGRESYAQDVDAKCGQWGAGNGVYSIAVHVLPIPSLSCGLIRYIYVGYLDRPDLTALELRFDDLPFGLQLLLGATLGGFLMSVFSLDTLLLLF